MSPNLLKAKNLLCNEEYTCVLCNREDIYTSNERGIKPLLDFYDSKTDFSGFSAADKVIGRGAAFIYILLGIKDIYAHIISKGAINIFKENGINIVYDTETEYIINRTKTGICPIEESVGNINNKTEALAAIRCKLKELNQHQSQ